MKNIVLFVCFFLFYILHKLIYVTTVIYFALEKVSRQKQTENESSNRDSELLFAVRFGILMDRNLLKNSVYVLNVILIELIDFTTFIIFAL